MQTSNPFPVMNPYLENHWPGAHTRLIAYVCDAIGEKLPSDLSSRAKEEIAIEFPSPLTERLPAIRVPLRPTDQDVVLDIQPRINRCYEIGRHWKNIANSELVVPLKSPEQKWSEQLLKLAGLRGTS